MEKPFSLITRIIPAQLILYLTLFFSTNNKIFFLAIIIFALYLFWLLDDFKKALWLTLVAVIPFNWGLRNWDLQIPLPFDFFTLNKEITFLHFSLSAKFLLSVFLAIILIPEIKKKNFSFKNYDFYLIAFFLIGLLALFFVEHIQAGIFGYLPVFQGFLLFFLAKYFLKEPKVLTLTLNIILVLAIFEGFLATSQFLFHQPLGKIIEESLFLNPYGQVAREDIFIFRASGSFADPNTMAVFWVTLMPLFLSQMIHKSPLMINRWFLSLAFILGFLGLVSTFSRFAWVVFVLAALLLIFYLRKKKEISFKKYRYVFLLVAVICLIIAPFLVQRILGFYNSLWVGPNSGLTRIDLIKESLVIIGQSPFWGVGPGNFLPAMANNNVTGIANSFFYPVHNLYLFLASETGLPALLCFLLFLILLLRRSFSSKIKDKKIQGVKIGLTIGILAYLFSALIYTNYGFNFEFVLLFLGMLSVL